MFFFCYGTTGRLRVIILFSSFRFRIKNLTLSKEGYQFQQQALNPSLVNTLITAALEVFATLGKIHPLSEK